MNKKILIIIMFSILIIATVIPVTGLNQSKSHSTGLLEIDNDWDISTNPPHMFSIPNGNIGIGTSSPERKLHIANVTTGPTPIVYIQQLGSGRGLWVNTTNGMCGIVCEAGNNGLRILSAGGNGVIIHSAQEHGIRILQAGKHGLYIEDAVKDGIHIENAGDWAGYFNGTVFINDSLGLGTHTPMSLLDIVGNTSVPLVSLMNSGVGEGMMINSTESTALLISYTKEDGIRITDAGGHGIHLINTYNDGLHIDSSDGHGVFIDYSAGDGIHVNQAEGWAGYFNGNGYFGGHLGIGTLLPTYQLDVLSTNPIVARFSGRVIGVDAVNDDEFVTKGQVKSMSKGLYFTPGSSSDPTGEIGDIAYDDDYMYIRSEVGWKRAAFETWSVAEVNDSVQNK